jgi:hypothetical protein
LKFSQYMPVLHNTPFFKKNSTEFLIENHKR